MIEEVYEKVTTRFKIYRVHDVKFGTFYLTRLLFAFDCEGRNWQENAFAALAGCLAPAALVLDLAGIVVAYLAKYIYKMLCGLTRLLMYAAKVVLTNFLGVFLKLVTVVTIILILWLKWHEITSFIKNLF